MTHDKFGFLVCQRCKKGSGTLKKNEHGTYDHASCDMAAAQRAARAAALRQASKQASK